MEEGTDGSGSRPAPAAVADGDLIRYLDGEVEGAARAALEELLAASPALAARLETLSRRSSNLSALLSAVDPPPDAARAAESALRSSFRSGPRGGRGFLLAHWKAAAVIVLLATALAAPPVRAWLGDWTRELVQAIRGMGGEEAPGGAPVAPEQAAPAPPEAPAEPDVALDFAVSGATFDVEVARAAGSLIVRRGQGPGGRVEVTDPAGTTLVVLEGGIRVDGTPATGTVYTLTLPASVAEVRVTRGGRRPEVHPVPAEGELRVDLSAP